MALTRRLVKGQALTAAEHDANIDHFEQNPNGIYIPKSASAGIKIDETSPDWGWHDLNGMISTYADDVDRALLATYIGNIKNLQFDVNKQAFINFHIPHDYALGTDIYIHVHWSHNSLSVTSGAPNFIFEGTYSKGHNTGAFGMPVSVNCTDTASTTQYQHIISESLLSNVGGTGGLIDTSIIEPDGVFLTRLFLSANTMDGGAKPFVHFVDIHYQSTGVATKNKTPNFYT